MTDDHDARTSELLRIALTGSSPLLPFAEAVARHLRASGAASIDGDDLVNSAVELLRLVQEDDQPLPARRLAESPVLMASFFQNADLLPPAAPETARIGALVLKAMEFMTRGADWP
jgi:hypothetical protein